MQHQFHLESHSIGLVEYRRTVANTLRQVLSEYRMTVQELADILGQMKNSRGDRVTRSNLQDVLNAARIIERPEFFYMLLYVVFDRPEFDPRKIPDRAMTHGEDAHSLRPRAWETRMVAEWRNIHAAPIAKMRRQLYKAKLSGGKHYRSREPKGRTYEEWARHRAKLLRDWRYGQRRQYPTFASLEQELMINHHQMEAVIRFDRPNILRDLVVYAKIWYVTGMREFDPTLILELDEESPDRPRGAHNARQWFQKDWDDWVRQQQRASKVPELVVGYNPFVVAAEQRSEIPPEAVPALESADIEEPDIVDVELLFSEQSRQFGSVSDLLRRFAAQLAAAEATLEALYDYDIPDLPQRLREIMKGI